MQKLILISVLLLCSLSYGTTYFVDAAAADDTGDGSEGDPFKTITNAVSTVASGNDITVLNGAYGGDDPSADKFYVHLNEANVGGKTLTVTGESEAGVIVRPINNGVLVDTDIVSDFDVTFENMTFRISATSASVNPTIDHRDTIGNLTFTNCTIGHDSTHATTEAIGRIRYYAAGTAGGHTRTLTMTNCTIDAGTDDAAAPNIWLLNSGDVTIDNCLCSGGGGDFVRPIWVINGSIVLKNNTVTAKVAQGHGADFCDFETANPVTACTSVSVYGNTTTNLRNGFRIFTALCPTYVADNIFISNQNANVSFILQVGDDDTPDESVVTLDGTYDNVQIIGNATRYIGSDNGHGLLVGGETVGATVAYNYIEAGDFGLVCKGKGAHIFGNSVSSANALLLSGAQGCYVFNNSFYAPTGYAFQFSLNTGQGTARDPSFNTVVNNIFQAVAGNYCFDLTSRTDLYDQFFDYNLCYGGATNLIFYNGSAYATFVALKAGEATWETLGGDECDGNTIVGNPQFINPANGDLRLHASSPALNSAMRSTNLLGGKIGRSTIGAWQPYALPVQSRRPRYTGQLIYK